MSELEECIHGIYFWDQMLGCVFVYLAIECLHSLLSVHAYRQMHSNAVNLCPRENFATDFAQNLSGWFFFAKKEKK